MARTKIFALFTLALALFIAGGHAEQLLFEDDFASKLDAGWSWIRENPDAWRITTNGLEVRVEPGNEWGPRNDAKNILVRSAPDASSNAIQVNVTFQSTPTNRYEQADLVWFFDEGHMVKIGREMVDGKPSIVMGREENDKTKTIKIIPLKGDSVQLVLTVKGDHVEGSFGTCGCGDWELAGECDLPKHRDLPAKISLQFYQGPRDHQHWVRATEFQVSQVDSPIKKK